MSDLRGEIWSKVLSGVRYRAEGGTMEEQFAREEAKASAIGDAIFALVADAMTSDEVLWAMAEGMYNAEEEPYHIDAYHWSAREGMPYALRAAGITKGEGE